MLAQRMQHLQKSFIREVLKVTERPDIISVAGGLPNPAYFPAAQLADAAQKVLLTDGQAALQYSTIKGYPPLRQCPKRSLQIIFGQLFQGRKHYDDNHHHD